MCIHKYRYPEICIASAATRISKSLKGGRSRRVGPSVAIGGQDQSYWLKPVAIGSSHSKLMRLRRRNTRSVRENQKALLEFCLFIIVPLCLAALDWILLPLLQSWCLGCNGISHGPRSGYHSHTKASLHMNVINAVEYMIIHHNHYQKKHRSFPRGPLAGKEVMRL